MAIIIIIVIVIIIVIIMHYVPPLGCRVGIYYILNIIHCMVRAFITANRTNV